jgi:5-methyltetrahydropteroyltriglutamate--homocysteine methyltransferase
MEPSAPKQYAKLRTDVIGSLLRPGYLKDARIVFDEGRMSNDELRLIEDRAVREAVLLQERTGMPVVTDGEYRRLNFEESFGASVSGFDRGPADTRFYQQRAKDARPLQREAIPQARRTLVDRLQLVRNLPLEEFLFVSRVATRPAKISLINADHYRQRFDEGRPSSAYPSIDDFLADVVRLSREILSSLVHAGCRYIQIDAPRYAAYVDSGSIQSMRQKGKDPAEELRRSIQTDNEVVRGFDDVTFGIHVCRGNRNSMWLREGSYDAIAEKLFNDLVHDRFLLEYDSPRAGSFAPLRFVPKGKTVVLGLISTKTPELEKVDELKRRIDEASRYVSLDQLALSPQCGFSTNVGGNLISEDDQKRKLEIVVETAQQVWGASAAPNGA